MISKLTKVAIGVIALIIILVGLYFLFSNIYSELKMFFTKDEIIEKTYEIRANLIKNFEECANIDDYNCFCEIWPNFPASLPSGSKITFENKNGRAEIRIYYGNEILNTKEVNSNFGTLNIQSNLKTVSQKLEIKFEEEYPNINALNLISSYSLKLKDGIFFLDLVPRDPFKKIQDYEKEITTKIKEMPKCQKGRKKSIDFFEELAEKIKKNLPIENLKIELEDEFYIKVENNKMTLYKENKIIKNIDLTTFNLLKTYKDWKAYELIFIHQENILCNGGNAKLVKGDTINIKLVNGKSCIEKI